MKRLKALLLDQLKQGTSPQSLALACACGAILGLFPFIGVTTIFCVIVGTLLKLNQPVLQAVNYLMSLFQLLMMPVWLYIGESILREPHMTLNPQTLVQEFFADWILFFHKFGMAGLHAALAWFLIGPFLGILIYKFLLPVFLRLRARN